MKVKTAVKAGQNTAIGAMSVGNAQAVVGNTGALVGPEPNVVSVVEIVGSTPLSVVIIVG